MASARSGRPPSGSTASRSSGCGCPPRRSRPRPRRSTPRCAPRCSRSIKRARKVHADQRRTDTTTQVVDGGTVTERWVPVRRVGLYVPGGLAVYPSTVVMNVVPAQVAGVEGLVVASPPQKENGGLPDARVLAACALLGVDEVYAVGGAQAIAMLGYGVGRRRRGRPLRAGRRHHRAGQHLGHRGQAAAARRGRHRRRGRPHRDRHPGRRHRRPAARRRRPDQPGRARPARGERAGHRLAEALVDGGRGRAEPAGRRPPSTRSGCATALTGEQSGVVLVDDLEQGLRGRRRVRGRAPGDPDARRAAVGHAGPQRRRDLRRRLVAGVAGRLRGRLQPRAADRRAAPGTRPGCRCSRSCAASTSWSTTRPPCATSPGTWWRWPTRRTCRRTATR